MKTKDTQILQYKPYRETTPEEKLERYVLISQEYIKSARQTLNNVLNGEFYVDIPKISNAYSFIVDETNKLIQENNLDFKQIAPISVEIEELGDLLESIEDTYRKNVLLIFNKLNIFEGRTSGNEIC
jgi:hypothetical protein